MTQPFINHREKKCSFSELFVAETVGAAEKGREGFESGF